MLQPVSCTVGQTNSIVSSTYCIYSCKKNIKAYLYYELHTIVTTVYRLHLGMSDGGPIVVYPSCQPTR